MKPADITTVLSTPRLGANGRYHFLYVTTDPKTGKWYGGKHSTDNLDDGYKGSGTWVRKHPCRDRLETIPIEFYDNEEAVYIAELDWLSFDRMDKLCQNRREGGEGFTRARQLKVWAARTPEERSAITSKIWAGLTREERRAKYISNYQDPFTHEDRVAMGHRAANIRKQKKLKRPDLAMITSQKLSELTRKRWAQLTPEERLSRTAAARASSMQNRKQLTPEEKKTVYRSQGITIRNRLMSMSVEERSALAKKANTVRWLKHRNRMMSMARLRRLNAES